MTEVPAPHEIEPPDPFEIGPDAGMITSSMTRVYVDSHHGPMVVLQLSFRSLAGMQAGCAPVPHKHTQPTEEEITTIEVVTMPSNIPGMIQQLANIAGAALQARHELEQAHPETFRAWRAGMN